MKLKAAILRECNKPLFIEEIETRNLEVGQVLVEVHASGICGAQIGEIAGANGKDKYLPHLLGHEGGGIVLDIGPGVTTVKKNDHVVMHWRKGEGIEASFPKYYKPYNHDKGYEFVGGGAITTFNTHSIVSENRVTRISHGIPFEIAALLGCAVTTGLGLINNEAKLKIGQSILVIGCGGVGLNVIQGASMVSANPIVAIDKDFDKFGLAMFYGATWCDNRTNGLGKFDVVVDCTGNPSVINEALILTAPGGKLILVGQPIINENIVFTNMRQHYNGKTIMDSQGGLTNPTIDIPRYAELYMKGKLKLQELITHRFPLNDVNQALDVVRSGKAGRCILEM